MPLIPGYFSWAIVLPVTTKVVTDRRTQRFKYPPCRSTRSISSRSGAPAIPLRMIRRKESIFSRTIVADELNALRQSGDQLFVKSTRCIYARECTVDDPYSI